MHIRSLAFILIVASSFVIVTGQTPDAQKTAAEKATKISGTVGSGKLRDIPFPAGVDLQFLIKELARDLDLNVLFDNESFRTAGRKVYIELKNVTAAAALDYIFLQEGLVYEEAGPKTILVAIRFMGRSIPQIGVGISPLTEQLAQYFGVTGGILINTVRDESPASRSGLKAGDVIVEMDGVAVAGGVGLIRALNEKKEGDIILVIVRDHKRKPISLTPQKGIASVL